jgi:outer membrane protein assembly factor BamB
MSKTRDASWLGKCGFALTTGLLVLPVLGQTAFEWPNFRGPAYGGSAGVPCTLPAPRSLEVAWKRSLGRGYSGISVAGGKAVTLYATDSGDQLAAFDAGSGERLWQLLLNPKSGDEENAAISPLSTAAIDGGTVYALGPYGALVAAALDSGKELWRVQLDADGATMPVNGFAASPLVWQDLVVLPTGGAGHAVTAFDKKTGRVRWTAESGSVSYQSVTLLELAGQEQLVATANRWLAGLEPKTGKTLWKYSFAEHSEPQQTAHVTPAGKDRLLVNLQDTSVGLQIAAGPAGLEARERFRSPAFANTLTLPVYHNGTIYGFTGRFLTALDAESGQIRWRSRPPGGNGLALVDGKLAAIDDQGHLVLIAADPMEYHEIARVKALEKGELASPSFAGGIFFVRNLGEIAAVRPSAAAPPPQELRFDLFGQ